MKILVFVVLVSLSLVQGDEKKRTSLIKCQEFNEIIINDNICNERELLSVGQLKDYPFVGVIGFEAKGSKSEFDWVCSGTLISDQYVLTTANCTYNAQKQSPKYVQLGTTTTRSSKENTKIWLISEIIRHPQYAPPSLYNDIALIKLNKPVNFTEYILPACLYTGQDLTEYNIAGFSFSTGNSEIKSGLLLNQKNTVVSNEDCKEEWDKHLTSEVNFDTQFCTRIQHVTCDISSGAPLLHKEEELRCMQSVAGLVQLGHKEFCIGKVGLNVKVSGFLDWIENIVWPKQ